MTFEKYVCWNHDSIDSLMQTEATRPPRELFLASHTPLRNLQVEPKITGSDVSEESLAKLIIERRNRHLFIIVKGVNGSGKSHLIKWLDIRLNKINNTKVIFIARHNASLRGVLEQLAKELEDEKLIEGLAHINGLTIQGRQTAFLDSLATFSDPNNVEQNFPNSELASEFGLSDFLRDPGVRKIMSEIDGPVFRICAHVMEGQAKIQEDKNKFEMEDFVKIMRTTVSNFTETTKISLRNIRNSDVKQRSLIDILNNRISEAVRALFNIDKSSLPLRFKKIRENLHSHDTRLLLLIEDISCFTGIDDQLIEALITDVDSNSMAPICSVLGITDQYYNMSILPKGNIKDRITQLISLDGNNENTDILSDRENRSIFVANYMNAVRADKNRLIKWEGNLDSENPSPPPNKCESCEHKDTCHDTFGSVNSIGLYPFNPTSIDNIVDSLYDRDKERPAVTPRHLVKLLKHVIPKHVELQNGTFPKPLPREYINELRLPDERQAVNQIASEYFPTHSNEAGLLLRIWGDNSPMGFSGLSQNVFAALGLGLPANRVIDRPLPPKPDPLQGTEVVPKPDAKPSSNKDRIHNATSWGNSQSELYFVGEHKKSLYKFLLTTSPWSNSHIPGYWIDYLFDESSKIQFQYENPRQGTFIINQNKVVASAMSAMAWIEQEENDIAEFMIYRDHLDIFTREYGPQLVSNMENRLPKKSDNSIWNVGVAACQFLYIYFILNGDITNDFKQPDLIQKLLFSNITHNNEKFYNLSLNNIFIKLKDNIMDLRTIAINWLGRLPKNFDDPFIDVSSILPDLDQFSQNLNFIEIPVSWGINISNIHNIEILRHLYIEIVPQLPEAISTGVQLANKWLQLLKKLGEGEELNLLLSTGNQLAEKHQHVHGHVQSHLRNRFISHAQDSKTKNLCETCIASSISEWKNSLEAVNPNYERADQFKKLAQLDSTNIKIATDLIERVVELTSNQNQEINAIAITDEFKREEDEAVKEASALKKQLLEKLQLSPVRGDYI